MNLVLEKFVEYLKNNEITFVKRRPNIFEIHVAAMCDKFESWEQLKKRNFGCQTICFVAGENLFAKNGWLV